MTSTSMQWSAMMPMPSRLTGPSCSGEESHVKESVHGGAEHRERENTFWHQRRTKKA